MSSYPKISIVTPSLNQGKYLEQTIFSVISQNYPNLEYIVIDGGSTDTSIEIIKKYEKHLKYWVSEKDNGQSDAINKGLKKVTGDLFNWLNSDDFLEPGSLFKLAESYNKHPEKKIFCFGLSFLKEEKIVPFEKRNNPEDKLLCFCDPVINQPATFYSLDALKKAGKLNRQLHYSMDYELWLRFMFLFGPESIYADDASIAVFRMHADAKTSKGNESFLNDMANMLHSLSMKAGLHDCCGVLNDFFRIDNQYEFPVRPDALDKKLIERMAHYFFLKWKRNVYLKTDFAAAKNILKRISFDKFDLTAIEVQWLREMKKNTQPSSWLHFRAERKIRHILSR